MKRKGRNVGYFGGRREGNGERKDIFRREGMGERKDNYEGQEGVGGGKERERGRTFRKE